MFRERGELFKLVTKLKFNKFSSSVEGSPLTSRADKTIEQNFQYFFHFNTKRGLFVLLTFFHLLAGKIINQKVLNDNFPFLLVLLIIR